MLEVVLADGVQMRPSQVGGKLLLLLVLVLLVAATGSLLLESEGAKVDLNIDRRLVFANLVELCPLGCVVVVAPVLIFC